MLLNHRNEDRETPLHWAANRGQKRAVLVSPPMPAHARPCPPPASSL